MTKEKAEQLAGAIEDLIKQILIDQDCDDSYSNYFGIVNAKKEIVDILIHD